MRSWAAGYRANFEHTVQYTIQLAVASALRYTEHKRLRQWHLL